MRFIMLHSVGVHYFLKDSLATRCLNWKDSSYFLQKSVSKNNSINKSVSRPSYRYDLAMVQK